MSPLSRYVSCAAYEIHVTEWGDADAPAVIAWHGLARTGRDMDDLAQHLAGQGWRVLCPDTLGRGLSEWSRAPAE
ncbi:MAG: alpha/beta hydrolase, partial [Burkholderiaceae bacterium]|nr:alpha/beta hydrolase [Burkholderiaceae bacterium]